MDKVELELAICFSGVECFGFEKVSTKAIPIETSRGLLELSIV